MYLPDGVYRGTIVIPGTKQWITIEIVGESEPTPVFGTIGTIPLQKNGTIVKSLAKSGPAVILAANSPERLYASFSGVNVIIRNLDVRTYDNPGISGGEIKTPTIDRLASEGVRFSQFYNCAICGPSRASLMTDCYPWKEHK